jgi:hypothetical protein
MAAFAKNQEMNFYFHPLIAFEKNQEEYISKLHFSIIYPTKMSIFAVVTESNRVVTASLLTFMQRRPYNRGNK